MRAKIPWPMPSPAISATTRLTRELKNCFSMSSSLPTAALAKMAMRLGNSLLHSRQGIQGCIGSSLRCLSCFPNHASEHQSQVGSRKRGRPRFLRGAPLFPWGLPQNISQHPHFREDRALTFRGLSRRVFRRPHFVDARPLGLRERPRFVGECPLFIWGAPLFSDFHSATHQGHASAWVGSLSVGVLSRARSGHLKPQTPTLCAHSLGEASIRIPSRRASPTASATRICAGGHPAMRLNPAILALSPTHFPALHPQNLNPK
jgi:hypothetical protein